MFLWVMFCGASLLMHAVHGQDSIPVTGGLDSSRIELATSRDQYGAWVDYLFQQHPRLSFARETPLSVNAVPHQSTSQEPFFYLLFSLTGIFAFLRFAYPRYVDNMFRVFFNTSLRQNQLTDQLAQARLASLFFNLLFVLVGGLVFAQVSWVVGGMGNKFSWELAGWSMVGLAGVYLIKSVWLQMAGWMTGYQKAAAGYTFIVFFIHKILGILLLPFAWLLAFGSSGIQLFAATAAMVLAGLMLLVRYLRAYGATGPAVQVSSWHFLLYVFGLEVLPLLLIAKGLALLFIKMR